MVAELILGDQEQTRKRQSRDDKRHLLEGPRVYRAIKLTHVAERTQALCITSQQKSFGVFLRARHVLDACIHINTLKLLVEAG